MPEAVVVAIEDSLVIKLNGLTAARRRPSTHWLSAGISTRTCLPGVSQRITLTPSEGQGYAGHGASP